MKQFYKLYQEVLANEKLTRTQQLIISVLINRAEYYNGKEFYCYESWIASEVRCSEKTVKRAVKYFAEIGLLSINKTYNKEQKKTTNWYKLNIDTKNNSVVAKTELMVSGTKEIEENNNNSTNIIKENMIDIENTFIPDEILYPIEQNVNISECKMVVADDVKETIKTHLLKNVNKQNKGTIYYPAIRDKYGYSFRQVIESAKQLAEEKVIEYHPSEKDGRIYHYYNLPDDGKKRALEQWKNVCKKIWGISNGNEDYISQAAKYVDDYIKRGISVDALIDIMYSVKSVA